MIKKIRSGYWWIFLGVFLGFQVLAISSKAQSIVSGTVISQEDGSVMERVAVSSKKLRTGILTDYKGQYSLQLAEEDTLIFSFLGFKDQKFPIHSGWNTYYTINVSMEILPVNLKGTTIVQRRNFIDDSLQFRADNQAIFNFKDPKVVSYQLPVPSTNITNPTYPFGFQGPEFSGGLGISVSEFYDKFLKNQGKRFKEFRKTLLLKEKEDYVKRYFNATTVSSITGLKGKELKDFLQNYPPKFKSLVGKSDYDIDAKIKELYLKYKSDKQSSLKMP